MMEAVIRQARERGATDIHVTAGEPIRFRVRGRLERTEYVAESAVWQDWWQGLLTEAERSLLATAGAVEVAPASGMRVALYRTDGAVAGAIRLLSPLAALPPDPNPDLLGRAAEVTGGLVLIGGATGSGKTTTLWRIVEIINATRPVHVISLEDPPEYRLPSQAACIHQRGIGTDVPDWETGLVSALREDPDVLVIGELRMAGTVAAALRAAQTGHLVLATLHAGSAEAVIGRLVHMFALGGQEEIRYQLASALQLLIVQQLVLLVQVQAVVREWVWRNPAMVTLVRDGKEHQMAAYLQTMGDQAQTWEQSRQQLLTAGLVAADAAVLRGWRP